MDFGSVLAKQLFLAACFLLKSGKNPPQIPMGIDPFDDIGNLMPSKYCYPSSSLEFDNKYVLMSNVQLDRNSQNVIV